ERVGQAERGDGHPGEEEQRGGRAHHGADSSRTPRPLAPSGRRGRPSRPVSCQAMSPITSARRIHPARSPFQMNQPTRLRTARSQRKGTYRDTNPFHPSPPPSPHPPPTSPRRRRPITPAF